MDKRKCVGNALADMRFHHNYKDDAALRDSFFALAASTFGIRFDKWHERGFWNERYIPYSFAVKEQVIANVSANLLDLVIEGERKRAVQIGTVMTHPDYRNQGLSTELMNRVMAEYEGRYDVMYLFANESVLDFYPRFGFQAVEERLFTLAYTPTVAGRGRAGVRRLDVEKEEDLRLLYTYACERMPVSRRFATERAEGIFMFHCLQAFPDDLYYLPEEDAVVICKQAENRLELFDLVSKREVRIRDVLAKMAGPDTGQVVFHFTPDDPAIAVEDAPFSSGLFVIAEGGSRYPAALKHPLTSIA
ncbi:GNAT family N-acetyltransferase [Brevibacillus sp. TJ4]|uniref:GNAT family N-acetyltransferase n=1 Tax=Brevibacillus sp. TJ4 TaxID=3234853 RepID=UPI003BA09C8D